MISSAEFKNDNNSELKNIQNNSSGGLIKSMIVRTCSYYLNAARMFNIENQLTETLAFKSEYIKKTFDPVYEFIAAYYRLVNMADPIDMFYNSAENRKKLEADWAAHFNSEIEDLLNDPAYVKNMVTAYCNEQAAESYYTHLGLRCKNSVNSILVTLSAKYPDYPAEGQFASAVKQAAKL